MLYRLFKAIVHNAFLKAFRYTNMDNYLERRMTMKKLLVAIFRLYQKIISPLFPPSCRFHPTCSNYGIEAVSRFGAIKGGYLTMKRILRCQPLCKGGYDLVPLEWPSKKK